MTLDRLSDFAAGLDSLSSALTMGGGEMALTQQEVTALLAQAGQLQSNLKKLSDYAIPGMLVHPDLWLPNITRSRKGFSVHDWAGTAVAHPFFSLMKLIRFRDLEIENKLPAKGDPAVDDALVERITGAYLEAFSGLETPERLAEAFALVQEVYGLWRLYIWNQALAWEEPMSVGFQSVVRHLQRIARQMVEAS